MGSAKKRPRIGNIFANVPQSAVNSGSDLILEFKDDVVDDYDSITVSNSKATFHSKDGKVSLSTSGLSLGSNNASIFLWRGGKSQNLDYNYTVVSDVIPEERIVTPIKTTSRDAKSYTQGYEINNGVLYESGGQYGTSLIRSIQPQGLKTIKEVALPKEYFAEGLTVMGDKIYQITWKEGVCLIYDKSLNLLSKVPFTSSTGEGWGLTNDGKNLILSDGSGKISYLDPATMAVQKTISVYAGSKAVNYINELEYVDGQIYANIYTTNQIIKFDANTGKVSVVYDLSQMKQNHNNADVLNGIAYKPANSTFLVTGKYWDKVYEVKL
jgi:glutamine cyclotransferase